LQQQALLRAARADAGWVKVLQMFERDLQFFRCNLQFDGMTSTSSSSDWVR
jgi:hypothetical protein